MRTNITGVVWLGVCAALLAMPAMAQWRWTPQTGRWINIDRLPKETAELQIEYARSLMLNGEYKKALDETNKFNRFYDDSGMLDENQFLRAEIHMKQGKLMDAANAFQRIVVNHPDTAHYDEAVAMQYAIGDEYYKMGLERQDHWWRLLRKRPLRKAAEVYSMVIENDPFSDAAAQAQYKTGLVQFARGEYLESAFEYRRVIEEYSGSQWVDEASYGLAISYYEMSPSPDYDQTPSRLAMRAIEDFILRYPGDARVEELREKTREMLDKIARQRLQTADFYERRRLFKAARIYYEAVAESYPETPSAEKARAWLEKNGPGAPEGRGAKRRNNS